MRPFGPRMSNIDGQDHQAQTPYFSLRRPAPPSALALVLGARGNSYNRVDPCPRRPNRSPRAQVCLAVIWECRLHTRDKSNQGFAFGSAAAIARVIRRII